MNQSRLYGIISSAVTCLLLLLILLFVKIANAPIPEDEGISVSFGSEDFGGGYGEVQEAIPTTPTAPPPTPTAPSNNDLLAQEDEESLAIDEQRKKEEKAKAAEQEALRLKREEEQRILAEKIAREKAEAEQKRKEQEAIDKAQQLGNLFGSQESATGSGNTTGDKKEGNPAGKGTSGGNSWSLNGRNLKGRLIEPKYNANVEGKIVVRIRVNTDGKVISATIGESTISDSATRNAAIKAAQNTLFSSGDREVTGSITYVFRLR